jgi:cytochrome c oxidase subunit 2
MMAGRTARAGLVLIALSMLAGCGSSTGDLTGADLALEVGCLACHGETDTDLAPGLEGLWGSEVLLEDGRSVVADEAYVRKSITDPGADIVTGFDGRMPLIVLTEIEIDRLVDYVRSIG